MNRNHVEGSLKDFIGAIQQMAGQLIGYTNQQEKGAAKQVEGKVQKGVGDVEQRLDTEARIARFTKQNPRQRKLPTA